MFSYNSDLHSTICAYSKLTGNQQCMTTGLFKYTENKC